MLSINKKWAVILPVLFMLVFYGGIKYADFRHGSEKADLALNSMDNMIADHEEEEKKNLYIVVYVGGQVEKPGVYRLPKGARVYEAVEQAGGTTDRADLKYVPLARILEDEETIWIPSSEETEGMGNGYTPGFSLNSGNTSGKVNINTASAEEMADKLNGIGPQLAGRIVDYRNQNGKFKTIDEIKNVSGIGEKRFEQIKDQICVR